MYWLVLNPPPGTSVISFFVTARLAAQSDSTAFTDALLDQLAAVTGEQVPPSTPAAVRDGLRRRLLEKAAAQAVKAGRRLVLVVDGLDEDSGSLPGSGLPSVAACLPKRFPDGLRVIVAGRPDPPLPADVNPTIPCTRARSVSWAPRPMLPMPCDGLSGSLTRSWPLTGIVTMASGMRFSAWSPPPAAAWEIATCNS